MDGMKFLYLRLINFSFVSGFSSAVTSSLSSIIFIEQIFTVPSLLRVLSSVSLLSFCILTLIYSGYDFVCFIISLYSSSFEFE